MPVSANRVGSLLTAFFTGQQVIDYASAKTSDTAAFKFFHRTLLENGVYWPPSQFEAAFLSTAHGRADLEATIAAVEKALAAVKERR